MKNFNVGDTVQRVRGIGIRYEVRDAKSSRVGEEVRHEIKFKGGQYWHPSADYELVKPAPPAPAAYPSWDDVWKGDFVSAEATFGDTKVRYEGTVSTVCPSGVYLGGDHFVYVTRSASLLTHDPVKPKLPTKFGSVIRDEHGVPWVLGTKYWQSDGTVTSTDLAGWELDLLLNSWTMVRDGVEDE